MYMCLYVREMYVPPQVPHRVHRDGQGDEVTIPKEHFVISLFRGSVFCLKPLPIMRNPTSWSPVGSLMV